MRYFAISLSAVLMKSEDVVQTRKLALRTRARAYAHMKTNICTTLDLFSQLMQPGDTAHALKFGTDAMPHHSRN